MTEEQKSEEQIWNTFIIEYSEAGLKTYTEDYFKQLGLKSQVTVLVGELDSENAVMNGGVRHSAYPSKKEDNASITVPYNFFYYKKN